MIERENLPELIKQLQKLFSEHRHIALTGTRMCLQKQQHLNILTALK